MLRCLLPLLAGLPPLFGIGAGRPDAVEPVAAGTQVLVLGTYHFANPGLDMVNAQVDDVLSPRRQEEIEAIAQSLARFAPTKILLEMPAAVEGSFNERYHAYLAGERSLERNEHDQLGMRLAALLDLEQLYGIDSGQGLDIEAVLERAVELGQERVADELGEQLMGIQAAIARMHAPGRTTAQMLRSHNQPEPGLDSSIYMRMAEVGDETDPIGANLVADWYRRNLRIFGNLLRCIEAGDERVLVIYGSGHRALLTEFVSQHPRLVSVDPLEFLPAE